MKQRIKQVLVCLLVVILLLTGVSVIQTQTGIASITAQAATKQTSTTKPVISSTQTTIRSNTCTVATGKKVKLTAKSGKTTVTKKGTWKSSKTAVATIGKNTGILTAKKAGTTYITVAYNGKTSARLKVVVKKAASSEAYTITYNKNTNENGITLSGKTTQEVSGEILKFAATVEIDWQKSDIQFLGWYTKKTGGTRVYESYIPKKDMTLYAHYSNKNVQQVTFSLGCSYGNKYNGEKVSFMGCYEPAWNNSYGYLGSDTPMRLGIGPVSDYVEHIVGSETENMFWRHSYLLDSKKTFTLDSLPKPSIPGYQFQGWYTCEQNYYKTEVHDDMNAGVKVEAGQKLSTDITRLYARFSKKLTISFDDMHGGTYDDIVIDTYTSIKDCGYTLPVPKIPGLTFKEWQVAAGGGEYDLPIKENYVFNNLIFNYGIECHKGNPESPDDICGVPCRGKLEFAVHSGLPHSSSGGWADVEIYEETDHVTLYALYEHQPITLGFDPKGGSFPNSDSVEHPNYGLTVYRTDDGEFQAGCAYWDNYHVYGGSYYGNFSKAIPGHEKEGWKYSGQGLSLPKVVRDNYIFDGWILPDGSKLADDTWLTESMMLTAKWLPGTCYIIFDPTDGELTKAERERVGLDNARSYKVTTESTIAASGRQLPIPVNTKGKQFLGWFDKNENPVTETTPIFSNIGLHARWSKP